MFLDSYIQSFHPIYLLYLKVKTTFSDVSTETLFDVLMDSKYRVHWDKYMKETHELGHIDQNNNISYYASKFSYDID